MRALFAVWMVGSVVALVSACGTSGSDATRSAFGGAGAGAGGDGGGGGTGGEGGTGGDGGGLQFDAGGGNGGGGVDPDAGCLTTTSKSNALPANLLFQLDLSGSMNCLPTDDTNTSTDCAKTQKPGSRWNVLRDALKTSLGSIPPANAAGLMHYPNATNPIACVPTTPDVPLAPLSSNLSQLQSALDLLAPLGGTPTHDAAAAAYSVLHASASQGNKYIVLATDGEANFCQGCNPLCDMNADTATFVQQMKGILQQEGIRLFVIGVPGSEHFRAALSQLAEAGGTAQPGCASGDLVTSPTVGNCHYDMTTQAANFGQAIAAALAAISGQVLSCSYGIPPQDAGTFDPTKVNVELTDNGNATEIPYDPTNQNGWNYSADGSHIELYGAACDQVKNTQNGEVDIVYGCPTHGPH